jgi:hypothetical protein
MTAEIPMSPRSTDDWVETLQTRSIPLTVSNNNMENVSSVVSLC